MTHRLMILFLAVLLSGIVLSGCASLKRSGKMERFEKTVTNYNALIRWGDIQTAAKFILPAARPTGLIDNRNMKDIRVISYERKVTQFTPDKLTAYVVYVFEYVNDYSGRPQRYVDKQKWVYNEKSKVWRLDGRLPRFGQLR